jgi:SAM-dependent methyltransferase
VSFSLNLPYAVCKPVTRFARSLRPVSADAMSRATDLRAYFCWQYETTKKFRDRFWRDIDFSGKTVLDFGSGLGGRAPYLVELGAEQVICLDINTSELRLGRQYTAELFPNAADSIRFVHPNDLESGEVADVALLVDCFEHFATPLVPLAQVLRMLRPGGLAWIGSIGWMHHAASHCNCYIPIPWCQAVFSERAIIRTIQDLQHAPDFVPTQWDETEGVDRWDKVTTLKDRPGEPLNMLGLWQIRPLLAVSGLEVVEFRTWPISSRHSRLARLLRPLAQVPIAREFFHSYYTAILRKPLSSDPVDQRPRARSFDAMSSA